MTEVMLKTHLIITDIQDEYHMNWCGKMTDIEPAFSPTGSLMFVIIGDGRRVNINTLSMSDLEKCAKGVTNPKGRSAITQDIARIYIVDENYKEHLIGILTHKRIKNFAPMYDKIGYK